jgi:hypothetical protein
VDTPTAESANVMRRFVPSQSGGGLVAAIGLLLAAVLAALTTVPGCPLADSYPLWLTWTLRLAPLPFLALLWAVACEADYKVRTDVTAIAFRHGLGSITRIAWREVVDYFADCGRAPVEVAQSGGSMTADGGVQDPGLGTQESDDPPAEVPESLEAEQSGAPAPLPLEVTAPDVPTVPPFAEYKPDYVLLTDRGMFGLNDSLSGLADLTAEIARHAVGAAPRRWEEACWTTCPACATKTAVSIWPPTDAGADATPEPFRCLACEHVPEWALDERLRGCVVELRGRERLRFVAPVRAPVEASPEEPTPPEEPIEEPPHATG